MVFTNAANLNQKLTGTGWRANEVPLSTATMAIALNENGYTGKQIHQHIVYK